MTQTINYLKIIETFEHIRDIPYVIPLSLEEMDNSCNSKCIHLKKEFESLGLQCRYRVCDFLRNDLPIKEEIKQISHDNNGTHVFLEVLINNEWLVVDPTWDSGLKSVFQINYRESTNQYFAVKPTKFYTLKESQIIMKDEDQDNSDLLINKNFYTGLNNQFEEIRNKNK